jgi:hypothetical protein
VVVANFVAQRRFKGAERMSEVHGANLSGQDSIENYIREFPNQEQVKMMTTWLADNSPGTFTFTGLVDPSDDTVITPQATVDYG